MNHEDSQPSAEFPEDILSPESARQLRGHILGALDDVLALGVGATFPDASVKVFYESRYNPFSDRRYIYADRYLRDPLGKQRGYIWKINFQPSDVVVSSSGEATVTPRQDYRVRDHDLAPGELPVSRIVDSDPEHEAPLTTNDAKLLEETIYFACNEVKHDIASRGAA